MEYSLDRSWNWLFSDVNFSWRTNCDNLKNLIARKLVNFLCFHFYWLCYITQETSGFEDWHYTFVLWLGHMCFLIILFLCLARVICSVVNNRLRRYWFQLFCTDSVPTFRQINFHLIKSLRQAVAWTADDCSTWMHVSDYLSPYCGKMFRMITICGQSVFSRCLIFLSFTSSGKIVSA